MHSAEVLELLMLSLLLLCHAAAVAVAANNNFAAIGATIVAAVAADATACLRFAAVSTAVRSCCSFMLLCIGMLRLLHFFCCSCCSCLNPGEITSCLVSSSAERRTDHREVSIALP